jgi:hypothetical protein
MAQVPATRYVKNFMNCFPFSNYNFNMLLAVDTALAYTVPGEPTQKFRIKFSCSSAAEIWVGYNKTPVDPTSNTATTNSFQELVPLDECRFVNGGDTLSFISHTASKVSGSLLLVEDTTGM